MNTYAYRILLSSGRIRRGVLRLMVERDLSAKLWLEKHFDATVLNLYRMPGWAAKTMDAFGSFSRRRLADPELSGLLRDLAVMTRAGVPIIGALKSIAEEDDCANKPMAAAAALLAADLDAGASLSETFGRHPDLFPESVRNLILIGEETGTVDCMLLEAAEHVERLTSLKRDVRQALIYPSFAFGSILLAGVFWTYYVIPNLAELFTQMHLKLPALTVAILNGSRWMQDNSTVSLALLCALGVGCFLAVKLHPRSRQVMYGLAHKLPIARVLITASGMAFITEHLALLISAGVDITRSLGVLERSLSDEYYKTRIAKVRVAVDRGDMLSGAMQQVGGFPPMALRMIGVGEESGSLDAQLSHLAGEYRQRLSRLIASLSEIIKPVIILAAGAFFVLLVVALLLPMYDLIRQASLAPSH